MIKGMNVAVSAALLVCVVGCGQKDQPTTPREPSKVEQPKSKPAKSEPAKAEHPKGEHSKSEHPEHPK